MAIGSILAAVAPTVIGGLLGGSSSGRSSEPTTTTQMPWNIEDLRRLQEMAFALYGTQSGRALPQIPQLGGLPDAATDAHLQQAIQSAIDPVRKNFFDPGGTLSQIRGDFGTAGQYGGSRHALATGTAAGRLADTEGNIAANMASALYPVNLNYNLQRAMTDRNNQIFNFGAQTDQFNMPWQQFGNLQSAIQGSVQGGATRTQTTPQTPWWQGALGGAIAGNTLGNIFGQAFPQQTPGINPNINPFSGPMWT